jgi:RHS repeat-associated protein
VADAWTYNPFAEPETYSASVSGSPAYSYSVARDKLGRITQKTETVAGAATVYNYTYDLAGRLTDVLKNGNLAGHYAYDDNGNRLVSGVGPAQVAGAYDAQDRLLTYGANVYAYTANGELTSKTVAGQTTVYNYDVLGNLRSAQLADGTNIEYVIDGQNRRIGKKVNGSLTQGWLYNGQLQIVAELDGAGNVTSRFIYADRANVPAYLVKAGATYRIIADHLGSPRLIINTATGLTAQRLDYDEFGNITQDTNPALQPFAFAGGLYDLHTKLIRFGARDYDPSTGRWTTKDPIRFRGLDSNLYKYVFDDPINLRDPDGYLFVVDDLLYGIGIVSPQAVLLAAIVLAVIAGGIWAGQNLYDYLSFARSKKGSKPKDCPTGTRPIDQSGLSKDDIHKIKDRVGAGPPDWTGIDPVGNVITGDAEGNAVNNGLYENLID